MHRSHPAMATRLLLLVALAAVPLSLSYTVVVQDSAAPGGLVEGPQQGFSMDHDGAHTHPGEQAAVYDVMRATGNDWAADIPDVCRGRWHGIDCMPDRDNVYHVVSLSFGDLSDDTAFPACDPARSAISPALTRLPHLRTLFFYRCLGAAAPRPIPAFLARLAPSLRTLVLRGNALVGPIPTDLGNLTRLRTLDLHDNRLDGPIPDSLARLAALTSLDLSSNRLAGPIPAFTSPALNVLDLSRNLLSGPIPAALRALRSLIKLDLSHNSLSGPIPAAVGDLSNLILIDLSHNRLSAPLPRTLRDLKSLQALILEDSFDPQASTSIPDDAFHGMDRLTTLVLSAMNLHGRIPSSVSRLHSIRVIRLDRNRLEGPIPGSFGELRDLGELRLNDNRLTGRVPLKRTLVRRMRRKLTLSNNSGLCFDPEEGLLGGPDPTMDSGIGYCSGAPPRTPPSATMKTVRLRRWNPAAGGENGEPAGESSPAAGVQRGSLDLQVLVLWITLWFVNCHLAW